MMGLKLSIDRRPDAGPLWSVESMAEAVVVVLLTLMWGFTVLMVGIWVVVRAPVFSFAARGLAGVLHQVQNGISQSTRRPRQLSTVGATGPRRGSAQVQIRHYNTPACLDAKSVSMERPSND